MVFIGGCGRFFEGTPAEMLAAMDLMLTLPEDTSMFCGHEYTKANFEFVLKIEDKNAYWAAYKSMIDSGTWTTPSLLKDEKEYNIFMRARVPEVQAKVEANIEGGLPQDQEQRAVKTMEILRKWKNENYTPTK